MIGKLICFFKGHKRGKLIKTVQLDKLSPGELVSRSEQHFACPRCSATWTRKVKVKP